MNFVRFLLKKLIFVFFLIYKKLIIIIKFFYLVDLIPKIKIRKNVKSKPKDLARGF